MPKHIGLWWVKYKNTKYLVTFDYNNGRLLYFEPFGNRKSASKPDYDFKVEFDKQDLQCARFGCYDPAEDRIMMTLDINSDNRPKKVIALTPEGMIFGYKMFCINCFS